MCNAVFLINFSLLCLLFAVYPDMNQAHWWLIYHWDFAQMDIIGWVVLVVLGREQGVIRLAPNLTLRSLTRPSPPFANAQGVASPLPTTPPGAVGCAADWMVQP